MKQKHCEEWKLARLMLTKECVWRFEVWTAFRHKVQSWSPSAEGWQKSSRRPSLGRHRVLSSLNTSLTSMPTTLAVCHPVTQEHVSTQTMND